MPSRPHVPLRPSVSRAPNWHALLPALVMLAGLAAYANSFAAPFLLDDVPFIVDNPYIRHWWPPSLWLTSPPQTDGAARPVLVLSLAVNYALGGLRVWGYHLVNLLVHLAAALVLHGLVTRTLTAPRLCARYGTRAPWMALAVAVLWVVHPLTTAGVTYIIQRSESLMALCYLLVLYAVARSADAPTPRRWVWLAAGSSAIGMAVKPVMVTAPLVALLYDRYVLSESWRAVWQRRRHLYGTLALTWGVLAALVATGPRVGVASAGFGIAKVTPLEYLRTQPSVLLHYLRLVVWPHPLVLDYDWPVLTDAPTIWWTSAVVLGLLGSSVWALRRHPVAGWCGLSAFLILAPTSGLMPIADLAFEHRMYLPLAAILALVVGGGEAWLRRQFAVGARRVLAIVLVVSATLALTGLTLRRNDDYRSELSIWTDTVAKRPTNPRAHNNLGIALGKAQRLDEAKAAFQSAIRLDACFPNAYDNLGIALVKQGRLDEAIASYQRSLECDPKNVNGITNLGLAFFRQDRLEDAKAAFQRALALDPTYAPAENHLGVILTHQGHFKEAWQHYTRAQALDPGFWEVYNNLGDILVRQEKLAEALPYFERAVQLDPTNPTAQRNLHNVRAALHGQSVTP